MINWNEVFDYKKGCLYWKIIPSNRVRAGDQAGGLDSKSGYKVLRYKGVLYQAHRIIYEMHYGSIPEGMQIDHINRVRDDNRVYNLRLVTSQENKWNRKAKGYYYHKSAGKYQANICLNDTTIYLGLFCTEEEARKAYLKAKDNLHKIKCRKDA